ncbi:MAG: M56 family metallopeptidase [Candidatus Pelethousia sp.]|nr:M56 family metallopeptidase [Candidatus Pelethousia sp.]
MTDGAFITLLNMSLTAGYVILALALLRLFLRRTPRRLLYALWLLPLFRLVCPVSVESMLSLLPSAQPIPPDLPYQAVPAIHSGIPALNAVVNPALAQSAPEAAASANPLQIWAFAGKAIWMVGLTILLCYAIVTYTRLAYSLRYATREGDIWRSEAVANPMVLGLLRPRIYLPLQTAGEGYILAHEKMHISHGDHFIKPLAFLVLCAHWFNPLVWLAYGLMVKDMEGACDERVLRQASPMERNEYAACLLDMGTRRSGLAVPLAFGESDTAGRIKRILNYKKPAFWLVAALIVIAAVLCVTLLSNPVGTQALPNADVAIIGGADGPTSIFVSRPAGTVALNPGETLTIDDNLMIKGTSLGMFTTYAVADGNPTYAVGGEDVAQELAQLPVYPYMLLSSLSQIEVLVQNSLIEEIRLSHTLLGEDGKTLYHKPDGSALDEEATFDVLVGEPALFGSKGIPLARYIYTLQPSALVALSSKLQPYPAGALRCFSLRYRIGAQWRECCFVLRTDEGMYGPGEVQAEAGEGGAPVITAADADDRYARMLKMFPQEPAYEWKDTTGDWDGDGKEDKAGFVKEPIDEIYNRQTALAVQFGDGKRLEAKAKDSANASGWGVDYQVLGADVNGDGANEILLLIDIGAAGGNGGYSLQVYEQKNGKWEPLPSPQSGCHYQVYWDAQTHTVEIRSPEAGYAERVVDDSMVLPRSDAYDRTERIAWLDARPAGESVSDSDAISAFVVTEEGHIITRQYVTGPGGPHVERYGYMLAEYAYGNAEHNLRFLSAWFVPTPVS